MHALTLLVTSLLVFALAYRFYAKSIIAKILVINGRRFTSARTSEDTRDYFSSYIKIGTLAFLAIGISIINPQIQVPAAMIVMAVVIFLNH